MTVEPAVEARQRRFWRSTRQLTEPDGVTWLGESEVVKALEEAEARAGSRRHRRRPAAQAPVTSADTPALLARRKTDPRGPSPMAAAGAAAAAAGPIGAPGTEETVVTDTAIEEQAGAEDLGAPPRRLGRLGSTKVAAAVALILAVEVGYIVHLNLSSASHSTPPRRALPALSVPPQSTLPSASLPVTPATTAPAPATKAASAPATTAPPRTAAAVVPATTPAPPLQPCTAGDLSVSTTTDRTSYTAGMPVVVVTKVTDLNSCVFTPAAPSGSSCPTAIAVDYAGGGPAPMGAESCTPPAQTTMNPGSTETVTATLPAGELSPGSYRALGSWGWRTTEGVATAGATSGTFTIAS
ncbi:MAG: hypothetical protein KGJ77_09800 [Acidobacteriota bacterium]|nr:hypothetical protein [Acidobacteriota bacterium]